MYMVYWSEFDGARNVPHAQEFDITGMSAAMQFMESLRARQRDGEPLSFIAMASENPHSVGHSGVAETGPDYNWKKRRR